MAKKARFKKKKPPVPKYRCLKCRRVFRTKRQAPDCPFCHHPYLDWLNYSIFEKKVEAYYNMSDEEKQEYLKTL